jgi:hypothetical protein
MKERLLINDLPLKFVALGKGMYNPASYTPVSLKLSLRGHFGYIYEL